MKNQPNRVLNIAEDRKQFRFRDESLNQIDLNVPEHDLRGKYCSRPFMFAEINCRGFVNICCPTWVSKQIGSVFENSLDEIFNGEAAEDYRRSIIDGSFQYCHKKICPYIQNGSLPDLDLANPEIKHPTIQYINCCYDDSCNIQCPSCRIQKICHTSGAVYEKRMKIHRKVVDYVDATDTELKLNITGSGDPFGSQIFRNFLFTYDGTNKPNLKIDLQTNGVMFTEKFWDKMSKLHSNLNGVMVSFDANTEPTYNITRKGGDWNQLLQNMEHLESLRASGKIGYLRADFVVQRANYDEIDGFIQRFKGSTVDEVFFTLINDWGTKPVEGFDHDAIWKSSHPDHGDFLSRIADISLDSKFINTGNLTELIKKANAT